MRRLGAILVVGLSVVLGGQACSAAIRVPPAVEPTLDAWRALGMSCGAPAEDNVPSGLLHWSCRGSIRNVSLSGVLDGDDQGVFDLVVQVPAATDRTTARDAFADVGAATPALGSANAAIVALLRGWDGREARRRIGVATVRLQRDETWITLAITPGPRHEVTDR